MSPMVNPFRLYIFSFVSLLWLPMPSNTRSTEGKETISALYGLKGNGCGSTLNNVSSGSFERVFIKVLDVASLVFDHEWIWNFIRCVSYTSWYEHMVFPPPLVYRGNLHWFSCECQTKPTFLGLTSLGYGIILWHIALLDWLFLRMAAPTPLQLPPTLFL